MLGKQVGTIEGYDVGAVGVVDGMIDGTMEGSLEGP